MLSNKPYLLRAFYQWIVESGCTPILVLDATNPRCKIPKDYIEGNEIVFNISSVAVRDLKISNDLIEFKASFSTVIHMISAPIKAILAIYAEENGEGLFLDAEESDADGETIPIRILDNDDMSFPEGHKELTSAPNDASLRSNKPFLTLVE
jgi:stringent starvation protein B